MSCCQNWKWIFVSTNMCIVKVLRSIPIPNRKRWSRTHICSNQAQNACLSRKSALALSEDGMDKEVGFVCFSTLSHDSHSQFAMHLVLLPILSSIWLRTPSSKSGVLVTISLPQSETLFFFKRAYFHDTFKTRVYMKLKFFSSWYSSNGILDKDWEVTFLLNGILVSLINNL